MTMDERAYELFPDPLKLAILPYADKLCELRIRANKPITANIGCDYFPLKYRNEPIVLCADDIFAIVLRACDNSVYAYNDSIKQGYITKFGIRIGLAGRCVKEFEQVVTIRDFTSLCIRFPHQVIGCASGLFDLIYNDGSLKNVLLVSPPGCGKTTALRDLVRITSEKTKKNILMIDEKCELYSDGFNVGDTTDVIQCCDKKFGLFTAVKNLSPEIVATDELTTLSDAEGVVFAEKSGVCVFATAHGASVSGIVCKEYLKPAIEEKCFDYIVSIEKNKDKLSLSEIVCGTEV